jgi:drug/metabolite transporter (DMT)-like permease
MVGNSLTPGELSGNLAAFTMPITFAVLIMIVRKYPTVDMVPAQFVAGISSCLIGFLLSTKLMISPNDIFLGFLSWFFSSWFWIYIYNYWCKNYTFSNGWNNYVIRICFRTRMGFLFVSERPSIFGLIGGAIILICCFIAVLFTFNEKKKTISN